ncbi:MAG: hypothetical protein AB7K71_11975 [Polyangiaceae bacterium]
MQFEVVSQYLLRAFHMKAVKPASLMKAAGEFSERVSEVEWSPANQLEVEPTGNASKLIALTDPTGEWVVKIGTRSVDALYQQVFEVIGSELKLLEAPPFEDFLARASRYVKEALAVLPVELTRLATVRTGLIYTGIDFEAARSALCTSPSTLPEPFEWDWRCAWKVPRKFGDFEEATNTIAIVRRVNATLGLEARDALLVTTDVNTAPENTTRFDGRAVDDFARSCPQWHADLDSILETRISGERK